MPMFGNFGPSQGRKGLGIGPIWDHQMALKRVKTMAFQK